MHVGWQRNRDAEPQGMRSHKSGIEGIGYTNDVVDLHGGSL